MRPAIVSGIVTGDAPVSYRSIFPQRSLQKLTRPSSLLVFKVANADWLKVSCSAKKIKGSQLSKFLKRSLCQNKLYKFLLFLDHNLTLIPSLIAKYFLNHVI